MAKALIISRMVIGTLACTDMANPMAKESTLGNPALCILESSRTARSKVMEGGRRIQGRKKYKMESILFTTKVAI